MSDRTSIGLTSSFIPTLLIDSDVLIDYLNGQAAASDLLERRGTERFGISVITYMEALQGLRRTMSGADAAHVLNVALRNVVVLPVTLAVAVQCAEIRNLWSQLGRSVRPRSLDLLIAATALEHDLPLFTRNLSDYAGIPNLRFSSPF